MGQPLFPLPGLLFPQGLASPYVFFGLFPEALLLQQCLFPEPCKLELVFLLEPLSFQFPYLGLILLFSGLLLEGLQPLHLLLKGFDLCLSLCLPPCKIRHEHEVPGPIDLTIHRSLGMPPCRSICIDQLS